MVFVVAQWLSHLWLFCDPLDCSPPGFSVHQILQARILKWVAIFFSRGFSWLRDRTHVSCIADRFFITEPPGKQPATMKTTLKSLPVAASHHDFVTSKICCSNFLPFLSLPFNPADSWRLWEEIKSEREHLLRDSFQDCDLDRLKNTKKKKKKKIKLTLIMYFI